MIKLPFLEHCLARELTESYLLVSAERLLACLHSTVANFPIYLLNTFEKLKVQQWKLLIKKKCILVGLNKQKCINIVT